MSEKRLINLEYKLTHQDQMMHELNNTIIEQQKKLIQLQKLYEVLARQFNFFQKTTLIDSSQEDLPPHY
jgi:SlyX protein